MSNSFDLKQFSSTAIITENGSFPSNYSIELANGKKSGNSEDEYNPFEHRHIEHPNSNTRSFANLLKSSLGSGILAMPAAFKNAGTVVGFIGTIILGYICTYCVYMLVQTSQEVCKVVKKPSLGYSETVEEVFASGPARIQPYARFARIFIDWAMAFTILGACSVYVVLLVDSTKQMVDYFHPDINISVAAYCGIFLLPLLFFTQIKNLKYLAPFSALANVLLIATFAICLYYIFQEFPEVSSRKQSTDISRLPLYMGTVIFAMEGIGVVMPVENTMARPQNFLGCPGVLNSTMLVVVCLYTIMGFLGYVRYGDEAKGSITLNLPLTDILSLMAKSFIIIAIFFTYTLQFYVPMEIVWRNSKEHITTKHHDLAQIVIRAFFTIITVAVAIAIPKLEQIIGLEGAFFYSFLGLICPAILEIIFCLERFPGRYYWRIWKNVIIILFGTFVLVTGVTESIKELIYK